MNTNLNAPDDSLAEHIEQQLSAVLYRFSCPDTEELLNYRWGFLSSEQMEALAGHVRQCPHCSQEVAAFSGPPAEAAPQKTVAVGLPRFMAKWVPASVAVRMAERGKRDVYAQYYQVEELEWDITLNWIAGLNMTFSLQGQLYGPSSSEMKAIEIVLPPIPSISPDDRGTFIFPAVPPGQYKLRILSPLGEITLPTIELA